MTCQSLLNYLGFDLSLKCLICLMRYLLSKDSITSDHHSSSRFDPFDLNFKRSIMSNLAKHSTPYLQTYFNSVSLM